MARYHQYMHRVGFGEEADHAFNLPKRQNWKVQVGLDRCGVGSLHSGRGDMVDERSFASGPPGEHHLPDELLSGDANDMNFFFISGEYSH